MEVKGIRRAVFIIYTVVLCLPRGQANVERKVARLRQNVDFLLGEMIEFKREIQSVWDFVNNNISETVSVSSSDTATGNERHAFPNDEKFSELTEKLESFVNDVGSAMLTVQEGFTEEKHVMRKRISKLETLQKKMSDKVEEVKEYCTHLDQKLVSVTNDMLQHKEDTISKLNMVEQEQQSLSDVQQRYERYKLELNETLHKTAENQDRLETKVENLETGQDNVKSNLEEHIKSTNDQFKTIEFMSKAGIVLAGWHSYGHSHYKVFSEMTWYNAQAKCKRHLGYLAEIGDEAEMRFIATITKKGDFWLGGSDEEIEGSWKWDMSQTSIAKYTLWRNGEPNNNGNEDCLEANIWNNVVTWNDIPCNSLMKFVCEIKFD